MKKITTFGLTVGLLIAAGQVFAQGTDQPTQYSVQDLTVALTGFAQGTGRATPVRITNKDIFGVVGTTGTRQKLVIAAPTDGTGTTSFLVLTGTGNNITGTDVSGFFSSQTLLLVDNSSTDSSGKAHGTQYSIDQYMFGATGDNATAVSFNVQGITTKNMRNNSYLSSVNGTGNVNGADAVLRGSIRVSSGRTQDITVATTP
jgi:hypothetical protein